MYTLHQEVSGAVLVCVRVPKPQQQQHRTATPAATAVKLHVGGSVVPSPGTAAGRPCSCGCGGQDVSHRSCNTVNTTLSGNIMQFLFITSIDKFLVHSGEIDRRSSTVFGFLMPSWYSYSYHNNRYIFGQGGYDLLEKLEANS